MNDPGAVSELREAARRAVESASLRSVAEQVGMGTMQTCTAYCPALASAFRNEPQRAEGVDRADRLKASCERGEASDNASPLFFVTLCLIGDETMASLKIYIAGVHEPFHVESVPNGNPLLSKLPISEFWSCP